MREIVLDTETTGLDPASGHRIIEIGCVELINKIKTGNHFHFYINPQRDVPMDAVRIHGITSEFLKDKPLFKDIAEDFLKFIGDDKLIIHNAPFDMKFLNSELKLQGITHLSFERVFDTLKYFKQKFPGSRANLDALCNRFGIDLTKRDKHGALLDADLLADVYVKLGIYTREKKKFSLDSKVRIEEKITFSTNSNVEKKYYEAREFTLSEEEKENHANFLKKIKNPLWDV